MSCNHQDIKKMKHKNVNITHLKFSTLGRRYFGRSFLQLQLQCITQSPIEAMMLTINGTMKKWIIVVT